MTADDPLANLTVVGGHKVLPPCVILDRLGGGGMGTVYRAFHVTLKYDVAVKVLNPQIVLQDPTLVERFKGEARKAVRIRHQNVIAVTELCEHSGFHFIVMELVLGRTVRQRVRDRKQALGVGEALQITYEAAMGLAEAHRAGIIHRDMKPDNLLVGNDGKVKVADLGLAKATLGGGNSLVSSPNQVMGTPAYMPPEQWESAASTATDVWALGATMWFMLAGRDAISDPDNYPARMMKKILMNPFPDIRDVRPDVPDDVAALLAKATSRTAEDRFQDCVELEDAIAQLKTPRTALRDKRERRPVADDANTVVSPVPLHGLEEVERWLREDMNTRIQTPGRMERDPVSGRVDPPVPRPPTVDPADSRTRVTPKSAIEPVPAPNPAPEPAPEPGPKGDTRREPRPQPVPPPSRRWLVAALALLAAGGGYAAWEYGPWRGQRPNADPLTAIVELEQKKDYLGAIAKLTELRVSDPRLTETQKDRFFRLHSGAASRYTQNSEWKGALEQLREADKYANDETRPNLDGERTRVRNRVLEEVVDKLKIEPRKVPKTGSVDFVADLPCSAVSELILAGVTLDPAGDGKWRKTVPLTGKELSLAVRLVDQEVLSLSEPTLEYLSDPVALQLRVAGGVKVEGFTVLTEENPRLECEVTGTQEPRFFVDGKAVASQRTGDRLLVPIPGLVEAQPTTIKLRVEADNATTDEEALDVVLLAKEPPPPSMSDPKVAEEVADTEVTLRVDAGPWASQVAVSVNGAAVETNRDDKSAVWSARLPLRAGTNNVSATTTNVAKRTSKPYEFQVKCKPLAATFGEAKIVVAGKERVLLDLEAKDLPTYYVTSKDAQLQVDTANATYVKVDTISAPPDAQGTSSVALRDLLPEGTAKTLVIEIGNARAQPTQKRITLVLDTTPPAKLSIDTPDEFVDAGSDARLIVSGRDKDIARVVARISGQPAEQTLDPAGLGWSITLPQLRTERTVAFVAFDKAGNESPPAERTVRVRAATPIPVKPDPGPTPAKLPRGFEGFVGVENTRYNDNDYPEEIRHLKSTVVLVALDWAQDKNPTLYVAVNETTEFEWDATGARNVARGGVTARQVALEWTKAGRGAGLRVPTEAEWDRIVAARNPRIRNVQDGLQELVASPSSTAQTWQTRPSGAIGINNTLSTVGFRTVFTPPK